MLNRDSGLVRIAIFLAVCSFPNVTAFADAYSHQTALLKKLKMVIVPVLGKEYPNRLFVTTLPTGGNLYLLKHNGEIIEVVIDKTFQPKNGTVPVALKVRDLSQDHGNFIVVANNIEDVKRSIRWHQPSSDEGEPPSCVPLMTVSSGAQKHLPLYHFDDIQERVFQGGHQSEIVGVVGSNNTCKLLIDKNIETAQRHIAAHLNYEMFQGILEILVGDQKERWLIFYHLNRGDNAFTGVLYEENIPVNIATEHTFSSFY